MSKKNQVDNKPAKDSSYKNPNDTWWGKLILWVLLIGFAALIIVGAIVAIINNI